MYEEDVAPEVEPHSTGLLGNCKHRVLGYYCGIQWTSSTFICQNSTKESRDL